jgi:hypothetical protein
MWVTSGDASVAGGGEQGRSREREEAEFDFYANEQEKACLAAGLLDCICE